MKLTTLFALTPVALAFSINAQETQTDTAIVEESQVEKIHIVGVRQNRVSRGATGLTMELSETPQSISLISEALMQSLGNPTPSICVFLISKPRAV